MRNKNSHVVNIKRRLSKSSRVFVAFNELQLRYGEMLDDNEEILDIKFNVELIDFELGNNYTTDFLCTKRDGQILVRECVYRKNLLKPAVIRMLDASRNYWKSRGIDNWGIVLDAE